MRGFFDSLKSILKADKTQIDNEVFRLHYKVTFLICLGASLLVTGREYFGDAITCIPPGEEYMQKIVDTYCWIHSTFTLPGAIGKRIGHEVPHPGIETYTPGKDKVHHRYYQWVCFVLFFQGVCFYVPRYLWKLWEQGKIRNISQTLSMPILDEGSRRTQLDSLSNYLSSTLKTNDLYFFQYVGCEVLNFVNVLLQIYLIDVFLGGTFSSFGLDVLKHTDRNPEERTDPLIRVFPRMTKCTFHFFGSSGDVQRYDTLCILPLNVINEKIYIFLWFWFFALAGVTFAALVLRIVIIFSPRLRFYLISKRARLSDRYSLRCLIESLSVSDWFVLHTLAKNMDLLNFRDLVTEVARELKSDRNGNGKPLLSSGLASQLESNSDV